MQHDMLMSHVSKNGESRNNKRKPERKISKDDDHGNFCVFSNNDHQLNYVTTNNNNDNDNE